MKTKKNPSQSGVMRTEKELEELRREAYEIIEYYIKKYDKVNVKVI